MADALSTGKTEVLEHLQCSICYNEAHEARLCPHCSHLFCDECIGRWLSEEPKDCPYCRRAVSYTELVKGYWITDLQESLKKLFCATMDMCAKHDNHQLSIFCYPCEMNICVKCWFSEDHADHKESTVPLDEAFEHFKRNLTTTLDWVNARREIVEQVLTELQENERLLNEEKQQIDTLREESAAQVTGQATPTTVMQILQTDRKLAELRLHHQEETASVRLDRSREFMPDATELVFEMVEFDETLAGHGSYEANIKVDGFEWKCQIDTEDDNLFFYLCLTEGKPSECSVQFDNGPEQVYIFELGTAVKIGIFKPATNVGYNGTQKLTAYIRQTYADRFHQLKDYITRLEKQNAEHLAFKSYIAKKVEPNPL